MMSRREIEDKVKRVIYKNYTKIIYKVDPGPLIRSLRVSGLLTVAGHDGYYEELSKKLENGKTNASVMERLIDILFHRENWWIPLIKALRENENNEPADIIEGALPNSEKEKLIEKPTSKERRQERTRRRQERYPQSEDTDGNGTNMTSNQTDPAAATLMPLPDLQASVDEQTALLTLDTQVPRLPLVVINHLEKMDFDGSWKKFSWELTMKITFEDENRIASNKNDNKAHQVVQLFHEREGKKATFGKIMAALKKIKRRDVIDGIKASTGFAMEEESDSDIASVRSLADLDFSTPSMVPSPTPDSEESNNFTDVDKSSQTSPVAHDEGLEGAGASPPDPEKDCGQNSQACSSESKDPPQTVAGTSPELRKSTMLENDPKQSLIIKSQINAEMSENDFTEKAEGCESSIGSRITSIQREKENKIDENNRSQILQREAIADAQEEETGSSESDTSDSNNLHMNICEDERNKLNDQYVMANMNTPDTKTSPKIKNIGESDTADSDSSISMGSFIPLATTKRIPQATEKPEPVRIQQPVTQGLMPLYQIPQMSTQFQTAGSLSYGYPAMPDLKETSTGSLYVDSVSLSDSMNSEIQQIIDQSCGKENFVSSLRPQIHEKLANAVLKDKIAKAASTAKSETEDTQDSEDGSDEEDDRDYDADVDEDGDHDEVDSDIKTRKREDGNQTFLKQVEGTQNEETFLKQPFEGSVAASSSERTPDDATECKNVKLEPSRVSQKASSPLEAEQSNTIRQGAASNDTVKNMDPLIQREKENKIDENNRGQIPQREAIADAQEEETRSSESDTLDGNNLHMNICEDEKNKLNDSLMANMNTPDTKTSPKKKNIFESDTADSYSSISMGSLIPLDTTKRIPQVTENAAALNSVSSSMLFPQPTNPQMTSGGYSVHWPQNSHQTNLPAMTPGNQQPALHNSTIAAGCVSSQSVNPSDCRRTELPQNSNQNPDLKETSTGSLYVDSVSLSYSINDEVRQMIDQSCGKENSVSSLPPQIHEKFANAVLKDKIAKAASTSKSETEDTQDGEDESDSEDNDEDEDENHDEADSDMKTRKREDELGNQTFSKQVERTQNEETFLKQPFEGLVAASSPERTPDDATECKDVKQEEVKTSPHGSAIAAPNNDATIDPTVDHQRSSLTAAAGLQVCEEASKPPQVEHAKDLQIPEFEPSRVSQKASTPLEAEQSNTIRQAAASNDAEKNMDPLVIHQYAPLASLQDPVEEPMAPTVENTRDSQNREAELSRLSQTASPGDEHSRGPASRPLEVERSNTTQQAAASVGGEQSSAEGPLPDSDSGSSRVKTLFKAAVKLYDYFSIGIGDNTIQRCHSN